MAKRGPAAGSRKSGGAAVGRLGGRPRTRLAVEVNLTADDLRTLRTLALAAGVSIEDKASTLLANAITEAWRRYDEAMTQADSAAWEGEIRTR